MIKKNIISILLLSSISFGSDLICDKTKCEAKDKVSFMGYELYNANYIVNKNEEKIVLTYNIAIKKEKNIDKMIEKFKENNKLSQEDKSKLDQWTAKTIDTKQGSTYEVIVSKDKSVLKINGAEKLSVNDNGDFSSKFLKIWTGEDPVEDDFKKDILKAKKIFS